MSAQELWKSGRLAEAVEAQTSEVRSHPADPERRYFLFALLCFAGDLERASRQLDALGVGDERLQGAARIYRNLLASEADRHRAFTGEGKPTIPEDAPESLRQRVEALGASHDGDGGKVAALIEHAVSAEPAVSGTVDGSPFAHLADTDELLGPTLEVFAGGRYVLMPFSRLRRLEVPAPQHVLDLLWVPARLVDADGTDANVHLPVLYEGSHAAAAEPIRLGRGTEWYETGPVVRGLGQKVLTLTGSGLAEDDRSLLSVRELTIAAPSTERG
ncbi:MAG: type VI secretion system accessory protein TagJ [bacterium]